MTSYLRFAILTVTLSFLGACSARDTATPAAASKTPHGAVLAMSSALRTDNVEGFLRHALTEVDYARAREEWDEARAGEIDNSDREKLNEMLSHVRNDSFVDDMMAEIEPQLQSVRPQLPLILMAAQAMAHQSIARNDALTEAQKNAASELLAAFGKWAGGRDLADPALARLAIQTMVEGARRTELENAAALQALAFEDMVGRAGIMLRASKDSLKVYEFVVDDILASVTAETLRQQGETALVRIEFDLLDTRQQFDVVMVKRNERWVPESLSDSLVTDLPAMPEAT